MTAWFYFPRNLKKRIEGDVSQERVENKNEGLPQIKTKSLFFKQPAQYLLPDRQIYFIDPELGNSAVTASVAGK